MGATHARGGVGHCDFGWVVVLDGLVQRTAFEKNDSERARGIGKILVKFKISKSFLINVGTFDVGENRWKLSSRSYIAVSFD